MANESSLDNPESNEEKNTTERNISNFYVYGPTNIVINADSKIVLSENPNISIQEDQNSEETCLKENLDGTEQNIVLQKHEDGPNNKMINIEDTQDIFEKLEKYLQLYNITMLNYFWIFLSFILYTSDVASDLLLGIRYLVHQEWVFGFFTLFFVVGSSIFYNLFNKNAIWWRAEKNFLFWFWIGPYFVLNIQPLLQMFENIKSVRNYLRFKKTKNVERQILEHKTFLHGYKKAAALKHDESLWEATPQIIIQLFVLVSTFSSIEFNNKLFIQLIAIGTSALGLLTTRFTYHRAFHFPHGERVSMVGAFLMAVGYAVPLFCRAIGITCLLCVKPWYAGILLLLIHYILCISWWQLYGWDKKGAATLAEGLGLMLQPSLRTLNQCFITNVILFLCDLVSLLLWISTTSDFDEGKMIIPLTLGIIEGFFRTILVLYWWQKDFFIKKVIDQSEM